MKIETSPTIRLAVAAMTPFVVVTGVYLLLAGHNRPGGGFAAGLLLGAGVVIRDAARLPRPVSPRPWLAAGGLICAVSAVLPMFWGDPVLDQVVVDTSAGVLGTLKTGTALVFDIGVVAIVLGLIIATLEAFATDRLDAANRATPTEPDLPLRRAIAVRRARATKQDGVRPDEGPATASGGEAS